MKFVDDAGTAWKYQLRYLPIGLPHIERDISDILPFFKGNADEVIYEGTFSSGGEYIYDLFVIVVEKDADIVAVAALECIGLIEA